MRPAGRGLDHPVLKYDKHWVDTMSESVLTKILSQIRNLFVILVSFYQFSDPLSL